MKLKEFEFGFADATKEYIRKPEIFENAFCDTRNIINRLIDGYEFLLIGRKGWESQHTVLKFSQFPILQKWDWLLN